MTPTSPEGVALDVVGYDLVASPAVPEPSSISLVGAGGAILALFGWRRRGQARRVQAAS